MTGWFKTGVVRLTAGWTASLRRVSRTSGSNWRRMAHNWDVFRAISLGAEAIRNGLREEGRS